CAVEVAKVEEGKVEEVEVDEVLEVAEVAEGAQVPEAVGTAEALDDSECVAASNAPPTALDALAVSAAGEASELQALLATTRREAAAALRYFACEGSARQLREELDGKAVDFFQLLVGFMDSFDGCARELAQCPGLAERCHRRCRPDYSGFWG
ncbi:unnamed protein product, partial [Polarella glacialis]